MVTFGLIDWKSVRSSACFKQCGRHEPEHSAGMQDWLTDDECHDTPSEPRTHLITSHDQMHAHVWLVIQVHCSDSALSHCGVEICKVLVLHRVVSTHPPLRVAHQQALYNKSYTDAI